jgi:hypothetical protein
MAAGPGVDPESPLAEQDRLLEHAVLMMVLDLHPEHLTIAELVLKLTRDREPSDEMRIPEAIRGLRASGLLRQSEDVVGPTHAAVRMADLCAWR